MKGIDVSEHQGNINWNAVKNTGIKFAILRAGFGKGNLDDEFLNNIKNANAVGIPVGIYWFSYAYNVNMAKVEAQKCIEFIKPYKISLPIFFDFEYDSVNYANKNGVSISKALFNEMCVAFCEEIEKVGYRAGVYYNLDYFNTYVDSSRLNKYVQWYAQYASSPARNADIWQYSEKGQVPGISGSSVDMNILNNNELLNQSIKDNKTNTDNWLAEYLKFWNWKEWVLELQRECNKQGFSNQPVDGLTYNTKTGESKTLAGCPTLKIGAKGNITKLLQKVLKAYGIANLKEDGIFGTDTYNAVVAYQKLKGLTADGVVGYNTWKALLGL